MAFQHSDIPLSGDAAVQSFIQRVYQWMSLGLIVTGLAALWSSSNISIIRFVASGTGTLFFIGGILIFHFAVLRKMMHMSVQGALTAFFAFSAFMGVFLGPIVVVYTGASIALTFFVTAGTFAGVSIYGWTTKKDLTSVGGFCAMGLIGFIIASIVNVFFRSPMMYWILTYFGIAIFIGLIAYDTQKLKMIQQSGRGNEQGAVVGALSLYLCFINLFLLLLRLFGQRR